MKLTSRSYFQLSLRAAFLLLTAGCIALGILAARVTKQRAAVQAILQAGGRVTYQHKHAFGSQDRERTGSGIPLWARKFFGDDWFYEVEGITLYGDSCNDDTLTHVAALPDLQFLALWPFAQMVLPDGSNATVVKGPLAGVTDQGLLILRGHPGLQRVSFLGNRITDAGLEHLKSLPRLKAVQVSFDTSQVTPEGYEDLMSAIASRQHRH